MVASQGQLLSQVLDFYLRPENAQHWAAIRALAALNTPATDETIVRYFAEAARIRASVAVLRSAPRPPPPMKTTQRSSSKTATYPTSYAAAIASC